MLRRIALTVVLFVAAPAATLAQWAYTTATVSLRAGPDNAYPQVLRVYPSTQVQVWGCLSNWSWCDVSVGYERGWIYAPYLAYPYQGGSVSVYGYGPTLGLPIVTFAIAPYWDRWYYGRPWWHQRSDWYYRPPPVPRPPPPGWRPPPPPPPPAWRPPPGGSRPPPPPPGGTRPPPPGGGGGGPPPGGTRPPPPGGGGGGPPPGGTRPVPPTAPATKPQPVPSTTSAPPGPAPVPR